MDNKTYRILLVAATLFYLIFLAYITTIRVEWRIDALVIFDLTIFETFYITTSTVFIGVAVSFAVIIVPLIIIESGFLEDYPDDSPHVNGNDNIVLDQESVNNFGKRVSEFFKKHRLIIGLVFSVFGTCLLAVLWYYLRNESCYEPLWHKDITRYYGFLRTPLLVTALLILIIGVLMIIYYIKGRLLSNESPYSF